MTRTFRIENTGAVTVRHDVAPLHVDHNTSRADCIAIVDALARNMDSIAPGWRSNDDIYLRSLAAHVIASAERNAKATVDARAFATVSDASDYEDQVRREHVRDSAIGWSKGTIHERSTAQHYDRKLAAGPMPRPVAQPADHEERERQKMVSDGANAWKRNTPEGN